MTKRFLIFFSSILLIFSCSTKKDIIYVQDSSSKKIYGVNFVEYKVQIDDVLKIDIKTNSAELLSSATTSFNNTREGILYNGFQVDTSGFISFPSIGKVYVMGLTVREIKETIVANLKEKGIFNDLIIDVKLVNSKIVVLGEVNSPGTHLFFKNNLNIFEAIGLAGGLTINGERENIRVIRKVDDNNIVLEIDLTSTSSIQGNSFQIFSNDIIIVNPNTNRVKNAGIIGNSGTLLSLLSFLLSSIIIINN